MLIKKKLFEKIRMAFIILCTLAYAKLNAQVISVSPLFANRFDTITVTYNAAQGNASLIGVSPVYAHAGLITNQSTSSTNWKHTQGNWGTADAHVLMNSIGNNQHQITYSIPNFYGVPDSEIIQHLAFVFRNTNGNTVGRNADGSDILYNLFDTTFQVKIFIPNSSAAYSGALNSSFNVFAGASENCQLTLIWDGNQLAQTNNDSLYYNNLSLLSYGEHLLVAEANNGNAIARDTLHVFVNPNITVQNSAANIIDGINYINDTTVVLSLFAPNKNFVYAIGDFNNWQVDTNYLMKKSVDGNRWWLNITHLIPQHEYIFQYLVDGSIRIGDPYADKISDPYDDATIPVANYPNMLLYPFTKTSQRATVLQTAQTPYVWQVNNFVRPAKDSLVIYELLVRDFSNSHSYKGVIDSLDYLKRLGITAVQLMPVMEFESNESWGYNPNYFFAPDKYYGTKNNLKQLIDACHQHGMAVMLDIALNHAFNSCPLAMLYWDDANDRPAANSPWFNPIPKHPFNVGNDFNHESVYTKEFVKRVTRYWLQQFHADGYRFDLTKGFTQTYTGGDVGAWGSYDASRVAILEGMVDSIRAVDPTALISFEHLSDNSEETELSNHGILLWGNLNSPYTEGAMGYYTNSDMNWASYQSRGWSAPNLVTYAESHDEQRLVYKSRNFGASSGGYDVTSLNTALARSELAGAFLFTIPGPKLMWQFGEIGYDFDINWICRICPKPILWNYYQVAARQHLYKVWSALIHLKKDYAPFRTTSFDLAVGAYPGKRIKLNHVDFNVVILGNFDVTGKNLIPAFHHTGWWYEYFSGDSINVSNVNDVLSFLPGEYRLYTDKKLQQPNVSVSVEEILSHLEISQPEVFPNPSTADVHCIFDLKENEEVQWSVYDMNGKKVFETENKMNLGKHQLVWNANDAPSGLYIWKLKTGNNFTDGKISVQH